MEPVAEKLGWVWNGGLQGPDGPSAATRHGSIHSSDRAH